MMKKMKRKTYRNFIIVMNKLMTEKGYDKDEAVKLTHIVFENFDLDPAGRTVEHWYNMILSKSDYEAQMI